MYHKEDWLMKQIQSLIQVIIMLFLKKELPIDISKENETLNELHNLINNKKVNEAENLLFYLKDNGQMYIKEALYFYNKLNEMDDEQLLSLNFSRQEIEQGLIDYFDVEELNIFK